MKVKSNTCNASSKRKGLTLVEVVAGLMLMASLLVGILMACGRHIQQTKRAQKRLEAVALADGLLTSWAGNPEHFLATEESSSTKSGLYWRLRAVEGQRIPDIFGVEVIRLEIMDAESKEEPTPLVAVELVRSTLAGDSADGRVTRTTRNR